MSVISALGVDADSLLNALAELALYAAAHGALSGLFLNELGTVARHFCHERSDAVAQETVKFMLKLFDLARREIERNLDEHNFQAYGELHKQVTSLTGSFCKNNPSLQLQAKKIGDSFKRIQEIQKKLQRKRPEWKLKRGN